MSRRRVIWLTILAVMVFGWWNGKLDLMGFLMLVFVGVSLVKMFDPDPIDKVTDELLKRAAEAASKASEEDEPDDGEEVIRIRRKTVEGLRNALLRHHNSRTADKDYAASKMGSDTLTTIQALNKALERPRIST